MDVWAFNIFCVPDTDDVKQNNKNHETIPSRFSLNRKPKSLCFTSFVSSTRSFDWDLDSLISGQIVNSFGQGKYTVNWEFKNHGSRNHVSIQQAHAC